MKLYKATVYNTQHGHLISWHPNKASARSWVAEQKKMDRDRANGTADEMKDDGEWGADEIRAVRVHRHIDDDFTTIDPIIFEPTKRGILAVLRYNTPETDNG